MAAYWGIAAHSAYDMFSWYEYLSVILVFSYPSVYGVGISFRHFLIIAYLYLFSIRPDRNTEAQFGCCSGEQVVSDVWNGATNINNVALLTTSSYNNICYLSCLSCLILHFSWELPNITKVNELFQDLPVDLFYLGLYGLHTVKIKKTLRKHAHVI